MDNEKDTPSSLLTNDTDWHNNACLNYMPITAQPIPKVIEELRTFLYITLMKPAVIRIFWFIYAGALVTTVDSKS
ncbi:hypothetical protein B1H58_20305 (plasmid) [Pantoea alhagi]|uniref:Uncharacterized protein n=1 Tax=Pantoea alhagi TaxID=1891675 RepID=A0A1W6BBK5_9GAMM|nr:hypothetical protein [Pantoea alhagi]ARJ44429.1 hypothetical protein B1H58_20305 [Pantoea alhagi]